MVSGKDQIMVVSYEIKVSIRREDQDLPDVWPMLELQYERSNIGVMLNPYLRQYPRSRPHS